MAALEGCDQVTLFERALAVDLYHAGIISKEIKRSKKPYILANLPIILFDMTRLA